MDPHHLDHLISLGRWTGIARTLIDDRTEEEFRKELMLELAVSKAIEMVGEISGRLVKRWPEWVSHHPELQLERAYAMRNRLAHGYDRIDLATVWLTVSLSIPEMDDCVRKLLDEAGAGDA